jgi:transcriptional regulator with XRE-family HTH domain
MVSSPFRERIPYLIKEYRESVPDCKTLLGNFLLFLFHVFRILWKEPPILGRNMELQLKRIRKENGMSQAELAKQLGVDIKTVGNWERGNTVPDAIQLVKCASLLSTTPNDLMGWYEDHPRESQGGELGKVADNWQAANEEGKELILALSDAAAALAKNCGGGRQCHPITMRGGRPSERRRHGRPQEVDIRMQRGRGPRHAQAALLGGPA